MSIRILNNFVSKAILTALFLFGSAQLSAEELKVGAILPLTGELSILGTEMQRGIEIAKRESLQTGLELKVIYEDDQSLNLAAAVSAANKLTKRDKIDIGLTPWVEQSRPTSPVFDRTKTPLIVLWDSNNSIKESSPYLFSSGFSTERAGEDLAQFAYSNLNKRKAAIVSEIDSWAEIISESFSKRFRASGGSVVFKKEVLPATSDFRTIILKIKQSGADSVFFPILPPSNLNFIRQIRTLAPELTLLTGDAFIREVIQLAGKDAEDLYLANIHSTHTLSLTEKYYSLYGSIPPDPAAVSCGYEGLHKAIRAFTNKKNGSSLYNSLLEVFGEERTLNRRQKIYKVSNGETSPVSFFSDDDTD